MVRINFYTKKNCIACGIMRNILTDIINNYQGELTFSNIPEDKLTRMDINTYCIDKFPTIVIFDKDYLTFTKIEGTVTKHNVEAIINKYNTDDNEHS